MYLAGESGVAVEDDGQAALALVVAREVLLRPRLAFDNLCGGYGLVISI